LIINLEIEMTLIPANTYLIIIPRFISSMMMHLNVEPDTRNGINLMKFVVNHPSKFRGYKTKDMGGNEVIKF